MKNNTDKSHLAGIIDQLVARGEDKEELAMWLEFFDLMDKDERTKLLQNLSKELKSLQKLKNI